MIITAHNYTDNDNNIERGIKGTPGNYTRSGTFKHSIKVSPAEP
jgi:hypothetical protein